MKKNKQIITIKKNSDPSLTQNHLVIHINLIKGFLIWKLNLRIDNVQPSLVLCADSFQICAISQNLQSPLQNLPFWTTKSWAPYWLIIGCHMISIYIIAINNYLKIVILVRFINNSCNTSKAINTTVAQTELG